MRSGREGRWGPWRDEGDLTGLPRGTRKPGPGGQRAGHGASGGS